MSVPARLLPTSDRPSREALTLGLIALVAVDVVLIAFLKHAPILLALTAAAFAAAALAGRISWSVALLGVGLPLLDPISLALHDEQIVYYAARIVVILAILYVLLARSERPLGLIGRLITDPVVLWALGLGAILWIGTSWTPSPYYAHQKIVSYLSTNLLLLVGGIWIAAKHDPLDRRADARFDAYLAAVIVFAILISIAGFINYRIHFYRFSTRLNTLGINSIWIARTMGLALLALLALRGMGRVRSSTVVIAAAPMIGVTILAGARGPTIGIVLVLLLWVVAFKTTTRTRRALMAGGVAVAALLFLLLMPEALRERYFQPVTRDASGLERLGIVALVRDALANVFGPGVGTGGFSQFMRLGDIRAYPHNIFAEVGIENGIPGLIALIGFLWTAFARGVRGRLDPRTLAALLGFGFALWNAQLSGDLMANEWIWLYAGLIAGRTRG